MRTNEFSYLDHMLGTWLSKNVYNMLLFSYVVQFEFGNRKERTLIHHPEHQIDAEKNEKFYQIK